MVFDILLLSPLINKPVGTLVLEVELSILITIIGTPPEIHNAPIRLEIISVNTKDCGQWFQKFGPINFFSWFELRDDVFLWSQGILNICTLDFICATMLDVVFTTKASNHANHVSLMLGWFKASLEDGPLLATLSPFKPLLKP